MRSDETNNQTFSLPSHVRERLTPTQSAERIATFFAEISQEFSPLCQQNLPPNIQEFLCQTISATEIPYLTDYEVYKKLKSSKKPNSSVGCDIPIKIVKNFSVEISEPVSKIFNKITQTQNFPKHWKEKEGVGIPKFKSPETEDDLRVISKTPFLSKLYESFVYDWLMDVIKPFLDPDQYGVKGMSITHYLLKFLNFIHTSLDSTKPTAVFAAFIDMSKAFNRVDHNILISDLYDMKCPAWLLRIIISFLSKRTLVFHYKGCKSTPKDLPGGTPQGTLLGIIFFIVKFNAALMRPKITRPFTVKSEAIKAKYLDDVSAAVRVTLDSMQENLLQMYINDLEEFTVDIGMKINHSKSKTMIFSRSEKVPNAIFKLGDQILELISEIKLLGIMVSNDLKWESNTEYMCKKS